MKNRLKTALFTTVVMCATLYGLSFLFNFSIVRSSPDIGFSPEPEPVFTENLALDNKPKNIIFFIADGMGFGHLSLAMHSQQTKGSPSIWQQFQVKSWHDARSTYGPLTDSGASGTAMATGTPTFFDVIGLDAEGDTLVNVFEIAQSNGYASGIVTDSYIWDATPAAFYAHAKSRDSSRIILEHSAASELDLLFGELEDVGEEGNPGFTETYAILEKRFLLLDESLTLPVDKSIPIATAFSEDQVQDLNSSPTLTAMTKAALDRLVSKDKPFILMVESEEMDAASHQNNSRRVLRGLKSIQDALSLVKDFADQNGETLVVFTADHETGGMAALGNYENYPNMQIQWTTKEHSAEVVPLLASGPGAENFSNIHRHWEVGKILKALIRKDTSKFLTLN